MEERAKDTTSENLSHQKSNNKVNSIPEVTNLCSFVLSPVSLAEVTKAFGKKKNKFAAVNAHRTFEAMRK